jgi:RNA polymerase sigma-70 factor, ECF subfamily
VTNSAPPPPLGDEGEETPSAVDPVSLRSPHLRLVSPPAAPPEPAETPIDPRDFDALYRRYAPYVAAIAARILGRDPELDDLVQDAFLNALRGLDGLREPAAVKGWLAKITVRLATRRLRARNLRRALHLARDVADDETIHAPSATPDQRALIVKVYRVLDRLPAAERVAWVLRHVQGEPLQRIPELCECSLSTAQRRLARAQAAIEQELGDE